MDKEVGLPSSGNALGSAGGPLGESFEGGLDDTSSRALFADRNVGLAAMTPIPPPPRPSHLSDIAPVLREVETPAYEDVRGPVF